MAATTNELRIIDNQRDLFQWLGEQLGARTPSVFVTRQWRLLDDLVQRAAWTGFVCSLQPSEWTTLLNSVASLERSEVMTALQVQFLVRVVGEMANRGQSCQISLAELNMIMIGISGMDRSFMIGRDKDYASLSMADRYSARFDLAVEIPLTSVELSALQILACWRG